MVDHLEPSIDQLERAVQFISTHVSAGESVYVHCKGGHGRSAAVVLCWLVANGMQPRQAQQHMLEIRRVRSQMLQQPNVGRFVQNIASGASDRSEDDHAESTDVLLQSKQRGHSDL